MLCSPRRRARRTAELAGLAVTAVDDDLAEWDYGAYEGLTTANRSSPTGPTGHCGRTAGRAASRRSRSAHGWTVCSPTVRPLLDGGDVALVGHGHGLRVVAARWVGLPADGGALLQLDTATLSELGFEHGRPVVLHWNTP